MLEISPSSFLEIIELAQAGGFVIYLLLGISCLVVALTFLKFFQFLQAGLYGSSSANVAIELFRDGKIEEAQRQLKGQKGLQSQLVSSALLALVNSSQDQDLVRTEVLRIASKKLGYLQRYLRFFELVGSLAPLLGLFGTVLGMISAFQALETAGNQVDPSILSGGIWVALLTTAAGLAVAMPTVTLFNYFDAKLERVASDLDDRIQKLFNKELKFMTDE